MHFSWWSLLHPDIKGLVYQSSQYLWRVSPRSNSPGIVDLIHPHKPSPGYLCTRTLWIAQEYSQVQARWHLHLAQSVKQNLSPSQWGEMLTQLCCCAVWQSPSCSTGREQQPCPAMLVSPAAQSSPRTNDVDFVLRAMTEKGKKNELWIFYARLLPIVYKRMTNLSLLRWRSIILIILQINTMLRFTFFRFNKLWNF